MDERWQEIERIYHAARELDRSARAEFLAKACGEDADLRREVESLLVQADQHGSFLRSPAIEVAAENLVKDTLLSDPARPSVEPGTMIAHYRLAGKIGEGGMGEVYRARDTKLQRNVALKILPQSMARDARRMARFEREAQVLASLNHPNIAAIHGLEESKGIHALVMELAEGETLADRISVAAVSPPPGALKRKAAGEDTGATTGVRRSPMTTDDVLPIARQIAEALEYAHERAVIHRDLKPANVKITPEGTVKVLDFGLAKVLNPLDSSAASDPANSPTLTTLATQPGMILGTAAYMSPEQAKGQRVDRRCDIWAFGCVLYEMLTGRKPFDGETITEILAAVIRAEPEWDAIPDTTPPSIQRLIRRCLIKDPKQRLRDIGDARIVIEEMISGVGEGWALPMGSVAQREPKGRPYRALPWALAAILGIVAAIFAIGHVTQAPKPQSVIRFTLSPPENAIWPSGGEMNLSPDGRRLAFVAQAGPNAPTILWVRMLDALTEQPIPGTDGASGPFWSPDGNYIGFFANGKLEKVAVPGGTPLTLCDADGWGATWGKSGVILFTDHGRLFRVPESGGTPTLVAAPDRACHEDHYQRPRFLPDGRHFLFLIDSASSAAGSRFSIGIGSLDSQEVERLSATGSNAVYAPPGYLLYLNHSRLVARPFDARELKFTGQAVPIVEGRDMGGLGGYGRFAVSRTGVLAYRTGSGAPISQMVWVNRKGKMLGTVGEPGVYLCPAISPDGTKVALGREEDGKWDIWIYNLKSGTASRLTFNPANDGKPVWSADGNQIFFTSSRQGEADIYQKSANGLGSTQPVYVSRQRFKGIDDLSRDGRYAIYGSGPGTELWILPLFGGKIPSEFIHGKFRAYQARISPNGRYVAYTSNETGKSEVFVQTFPRHKGKWQISTGGGTEPRWRADGRELFFLNPDDGVMAVQVNTEAGEFQAGTPKLLFKAQLLRLALGGDTYAISSDGQRFLLLEPASEAKPSPITVVLNWPALLKNAGK